MGIGAAALLEKHWRPPISGNKRSRMVAGPHNEWQETQTENTSDTARVSHNGQRIGHMTVHQLQETQDENTSDPEAAGRLASKARKTHNATMSRLRAEAEAIEARKAEAEDEHTRWVAKHAMFQQKLESTTKDTHNITLGSNLGSHHITFEVTLPESSPESIIPRGRESSPESSRFFHQRALGLDRFICHLAKRLNLSTLAGEVSKASRFGTRWNLSMRTQIIITLAAFNMGCHKTNKALNKQMKKCLNMKNI